MIRRPCLLLLPFVTLLALSGCGRENKAPDKVEVKLVDGPGVGKGADPDPVVKKATILPPDEKKEAPEESIKLEKHEAALTEALTHLGDGKLSDALIAFETARTFHDTEFIRDEIAKVKTRLESDRSARKTIGDIETILEEGKAEEASKLVKAAFREFADDKVVGDKLAKLRLEADALESVGRKEDGALRFQRFKNEGDLALKEENLRAAVLAFDSALLAQDEPFIRKKSEELRGRLELYDVRRSRAAELRKDPAQLEEAIALLEEAKANWKTLQVLQDLDEYNLALSKRRDTLSVGDFEVRGDVGFADAGKALGEELLPHFKARFDLVERGQLNKVVTELKLEETFLDDPNSHRAVAKLAKVRYLVLGSIRREGGLAVNARLVDARSGLIVQTAKIVVPGVDDLWRTLPQLAKQLLMNDEEKAAYESETIRTSARPTVVLDDAPLPPAPALPLFDEPAPPPLLLDTPVPPDVGGLKLEDFGRLAPPPPGKVMIVASGGAPEHKVKNRLLHATLSLGDNLFRRGDYHEAHRHFEFALQLSPGEFDVQLRLNQVRPHLPPPPVVIVAPVVVIPPRPRVAILNFVLVGEPWAVPAHLSHWTPRNIAPYFHHQYDVVDSGQVYWYMAKMGLTLRDLMDDPHARRWLGRALGVRYFVLGTIHQTASFDVNTYLLDSEFGHLSGQGRIHVRNPFELKLRLQDLAQLTLMDPRERKVWFTDADRFETLLVKGRGCYERREYTVAINFFEDAQRIRPGHVEVLTYLEKSRHGARHFAWEAERRKQFLIQKALEEDARRRQLELARDAEFFRVRIVASPAPVFVAKRETAAATLFQEAQLALKFKNFSLSISRFESALALAPARDEWHRDLALARAEEEKQRRFAAAEQADLREGQLRRLREAEVVKAQALLEEQKREAALAQASEQKAREAKDAAAYRAAYDEGERLLNKRDFDGAIAALQVARRYKKSEVAEAMLTRAYVLQAESAALAKGETERQELEKKLANERARRKAAEAEAKKNQELYQEALALANKALDERNLELAQAKFDEAGKVFKTDAVLTGLKRTQSARAKREEEKAAVARKLTEEAQREERLKKLLIEGNAFLEAKAFKKALDAFTQAKGLAPENIDVLTGLTRTQQAQDRAVTEARRKMEEATQEKEFARLIKTGQSNLDSKQFEAAAIALQEALKLRPGDPAVKALLQSAEKGKGALFADAKAKAESEKKALAYQKLIAEGKAALAASRFDDAIKAFDGAQKVLPGDKSSTDYLSEARATKKKVEEEFASAAKKRAEEIQRSTELKKVLDQARAALVLKDLAGANKALAQAGKLDAKNPEVLRAQEELRQIETSALAAFAAEKKRRADYDALLDKARQSSKAGLFDDALKTIAQANALIPDAKEGTQLGLQVQKARADFLKAGDEKTRLAQLGDLITRARSAIKTGNLDEATGLLTQADKLAPKDASVRKAFEEVSAARLALNDKVKDEAAYRALVGRGDKALAAKSFDEAIKTFEQALKLRPGDLKVRQSYNEAIAGVTLVQYQEALDGGQASLKAGKFEEAIKAFNRAVVLVPKDPTATKLLDQSRKAWDDVKAGAADATKRKVAFAEAVALGDKAQKAKQYDLAVKSYSEALKLMPGDPQALRLLSEAQKTWDAVKTDDEAARRKLAYKQALNAGQKALATKQYDQATKAFGDALTLFPADPQASLLLKNAQKDWADAKTAGDGAAKLKAAFQDALLEGQKAMAGKKHADAVAAFTRASKLVPTDATARALLAQAQVALDAERRLLEDAAKKKADEAKVQIEVQRLFKEAGAAMSGKRFDDAQKLFGSILKLQPGQPDATRGYTDATKALDAGKAKTPPPMPVIPPKVPVPVEAKGDVDKLLQSGLDLEKQAKWPEAFKLYQDAAKLAPKDPKVADGLKRVEFNWRVSEAQKLIDAMRYPEATRELQAALTLFPGNPMATKLLERAKKGKK